MNSATVKAEVKAYLAAQWAKPLVRAAVYGATMGVVATLTLVWLL